MARMNDVAVFLRLKDLIDSGRAKQLRLQGGDTLAAAGRVVEVDPATILHWERGRIPRGRNMRAYLAYLTRLDDAIKSSVVQTARAGCGGEAA